MKIRIAAAMLLAMPLAAQQAPPATEVYLTALTDGGSAAPVLRTWINVSNSPEYDNQPSFLPDSSGLLFTSRRDGKQTDIYRYDIASKAVTQLTHTPESEYSATVTPDRKTFSTVRVEADGTTQRLWRFDLDGSNPRLVLENVKPVGYHAWIDATHLALFVLGSPATLQIADTTTGKSEIADTGIGRLILIRPKTGAVTYMTTQPRMIRELDPKTLAKKDLVEPLAASRDAAWTPTGELLMATGTSISVWRPDVSTWKTRVSGPGPDPTPVVTGIGGITRMAISPDGKWLAFVAEPAVAK
jgi:hypothetical protein